MGRFDGPTPKRHTGWSNDEQFMTQLMGRGGFLSAADRMKFNLRLAKKGQNKSGMPTFTGQKQLLKQSQLLVPTKIRGHRTVSLLG